MKRLLLAFTITALLSACATTTSPTGRRQVVGGVSQAQLDQLGAQAFAETKQKEKISTDARQIAYVQCVVNALVRSCPRSTGACVGKRRCSQTANPTPSHCRAARSG